MKIHHCTLPATDPAHVAEVLAELTGGKVMPLGHMQDSYLVLDPEDPGTCLEVWPRTARANVGEAQLHYDGDEGPDRWPHHANISVDVDKDTILAVLEREGWPHQIEERPFPFIRAWIEGKTVIELADPGQAAAYVAFFERAMSGPPPG